MKWAIQYSVPTCIERSIRVLIEYRSYWAAGEFVPQQFDDVTLWQSPMLKTALVSPGQMLERHPIVSVDRRGARFLMTNNCT